MNYLIGIFVFVVVLFTGCTRQVSFDELTKNIPTDLPVRSYSSATLNYSMSVPKRFGLPEKDNGDTLSMESFMDTTKLISQGVSKLVVIRYHFTGKKMTLEKTWDRLMSKQPKIENYRMYSDGTTDFLSLPAHYGHAVYTIGGKDYESIGFLFRGEASNYVGIGLEVLKDEDHVVHMKELLYCAKSIKLLPSFFSQGIK